MGLIERGYTERTTERSILDRFAKKEKDVQVNLCHLSIYTCTFPVSRNLILKRLC